MLNRGKYYVSWRNGLFDTFEGKNVKLPLVAKIKSDTRFRIIQFQGCP